MRTLVFIPAWDEECSIATVVADVRRSLPEVDILVVDDGRIVEDGTVEDLRRRGGLFDRMWRLQAEGLSGDALIDAA